ncbi:UDP-N-acetylmuramoyl-L-alanyl-D-glutamate--2,6-diaminopimelate ligase [Allobacillus sp. GCM10007491]|uniref:UDP-N-acetylmuramoyl-L-alanyl-D-glutamate--2, 6-diaminopimelate ligase n=1 Tax=Allobacillus saliphilus TaxID=2912308 RepID=A0A941HTE3_9BACI|nr:UDP-N-acetylmuramoyl-L-alanyl-D-glutamate--2,6-diaminopimelate ligase [Allobacillus saliphilus]MBR7553690.1 UDP-N-acetylmuramoyl-L-alanyl-D-glutamate--2,6-diaminopimelate ligase [Allobacillus saliphilus]
MNIEKILNGISYKNPYNEPLDHIDILGITDDSREVQEGFMFIAVNGEKIDGHQYIDEAIQNGASVVVGERPEPLEKSVYLSVEQSKSVLGIIAKNFYDTTNNKQQIIGITGTNGKTTTSYMLKAALEAQGYQCGVVGTIQNIVNGQAFKTINTTPNPLKLHQLLHKSEDDVMIVEVSSHALKQDRVKGVIFDVAIFTNLEKEHLDYHATMEDYFETKYQLFKQLKKNGLAIVNRDNSWGEIVYRRLKEQSYVLKTISTESDASILLNIEQSTIQFSGGKAIPFELKMPGEHNRLNAAMTLLVCEHFRLNREKSMDVLRHFASLPGRFESIHFPGNKRIAIDYAHTTKGIIYCLKAARECNAKRVIHVFGFRGNRDESKRADMLINSAIYSDQYILTLDDLNEQTEEEMIQVLYDYHEKYGHSQGKIIPDRTLAIKEAIEAADEGDIVLVTGKGHESYNQAFQLGTNSDRETAEKIKQAVKDMTV